MHSTVLRAMQEPGSAVALANAIGASEATVSRLKSDHLSTLCAMLAHLDLKLVPVEKIVVDAETYRAMCHIAQRAMARPDIAEQLVLEDE